MAKDSNVSKWNIGVTPTFYPNEDSGVGWHDDSAQIATVISTLVLHSGLKSRPIKFRMKNTTAEAEYLTFDLVLRTGDLYVMNGVMQQYYDHCVVRIHTVQYYIQYCIHRIQ